ncbi:putative Type IV leader peptidase family [uncultured Eubacteriales bacterium]|uniref:Putative Type IV leader peptidase family n=1 Tax=uncultured Eubacteriales bacterium TaxID=172733 RepID=A0A212JP45_9FIRM|nr:putative Type IV leader peptidase family [uncultured Eubacteriales bacterium]
MNYISILINAAALIYGGIADYKRREIPNTVPIILLSLAAFSFPTFWRIMGLILPAVLLLAAAKLTKSEVPGGDFKLICALGFACGLPELAAILVLSALGAMAYGTIRNLPIKRHIPLCAYVAPAYIVLHMMAFFLEGGGSM